MTCDHCQTNRPKGQRRSPTERLQHNTSTFPLRIHVVSKYLKKWKQNSSFGSVYETAQITILGSQNIPRTLFFNKVCFLLWKVSYVFFSSWKTERSQCSINATSLYSTIQATFIIRKLFIINNSVVFKMTN